MASPFRLSALRRFRRPFPLQEPTRRPEVLVLPKEYRTDRRHRDGAQPYAAQRVVWAAYVVASQTPGLSALQFQRQLGLSRYETAFGILQKLRSPMVRRKRPAGAV